MHARARAWLRQPALALLLVAAGCQDGLVPAASRADDERAAGKADVGQKQPTAVFGGQSHDVLQRQADGHLVPYSWVRYHLDWDVIEATEGSYDWRAADDAIIAALAQGNVPEVYIFGTPSWARQPGRETKRCGPIRQDKLQAFVDFVGAAVARYKGHVKHWEFWNEPDAAYDLVGDGAPYGCWGDPGQQNYGGAYYGQFLAAFQDKVKQVDPAAQVLVGGLLLGCDADPGGSCGTLPGSNPTFIRGVLEAERQAGQQIFDILAFHAYAYHNGQQLDFGRYSWDSQAGALVANSYGWGDDGMLRGKASYLRSVLAELNAPSRPLLMNEGGMIVWAADGNCNKYSAGPEAGQPIPDRARHGYVQDNANETWRLYSRTWHAGILGSIWYTLDPWHWKCSGVTSVSPIDGQRAAFAAVAFLAEKLAGARLVNRITALPGVEGYRFCTGERELTIYFALTGGTSTTISTPPHSVALYDKLGRMSAPGGTFSVSFEPLMLERIPPGGCADYRQYLPIVLR